MVPALGDRLLSDLEAVDFGEVVGKYAAELRREGRSNGTNANKLLGATRRMYKMNRGWGVYSAPDPTLGLVRPAKETPRDRVLFDGAILVASNPENNELGRLISSLQSETSEIPVRRPTRVAILLAAILGFRALEASSLEWEGVRLENERPSITIARSKTKAGLRTLPLPLQAARLLVELKSDAKPKATYVFPAERSSQRTPHLHPESLSRAFSRTCSHLGIAKASIHDLRRTCLSGLIELGHESVAGRIAGHAARDIMGRHYDRSARLELMRAALEAWAAALNMARARFEGKSG